MMITAWGDTKELLEFLDDFRVHPSVTRDSVVKRLKRHEIPELALTKPVCGEAKSGDTNQRNGQSVQEISDTGDRRKC